MRPTSQIKTKQTLKQTLSIVALGHLLHVYSLVPRLVHSFGCMTEHKGPGMFPRVREVEGRKDLLEHGPSEALLSLLVQQVL